MVYFTNHYNPISIDKLPLKSKFGKAHRALIIIFYVSPNSKSKVYNLVLKRMLQHYLKTPLLMKILQFQDRIYIFLLKTQRSNHSSASD